jgi:hypothetical protein
MDCPEASGHPRFAVVCWPGCWRELYCGGWLALSVWCRAVMIVPDTRDWTWVLERPCPECGLNAHGFARDAIAGMIRRNARQWQEVLAGPGGKARRPSPGIWSALEYACHVRDVLRLYDERLVLMLMTAGPRYPNWDQDATAVAGRYASRILPGWLLTWATPLASSRRGSGRCPGINGSGPAFAATGHGRVLRAVLHPRSRFIISAADTGVSGTAGSARCLIPPSHEFLRTWPAGENRPSPMRSPRGMSAQSVRRARIAGCPPSGYGR